MYKKLKAFSLIEISISLLIIGLTTSAGFYLFKAFYFKYRITLTQSRQQLILQALGKFTTQYGYLPYPCPPDQSGIGISAPSPTTDSWHEARYIGIIPWHTLGLPQSVIYDGYGNLMTYIMHPMLGQRTDKQSQVMLPELLEKTSFANNYCLVNYFKPTNSTAVWRNWSKTHTDTQGNQYPIIGYGLHDLISQHTHFLNLLYVPTYPPNASVKQILSIDYQNTNKNCIPLYQYSHMHVDKNKLYLIEQICDCIAVVLISHGTTGGHYDIKGQQTDIKHKSCKAIQYNTPQAKQWHAQTSSQIMHNFYIQFPDTLFDHIIAYSTRFNLALYMGPRCTSLILNKDESKT